MKTTKFTAIAAVALMLSASPAVFAKGGNDKEKDGKQKHSQKQKKDKKAKKGGDAQYRQQFDQQFARFDANRDGVITRAEFPADALLFDRLDQNRDGLISRTEAEAAAGSRAALEQRAREFDRNGDGVISRNEFPGGNAEFDRLDRNRDGVLSNADRGANRNGQYGTTSGDRFRGMDKNRDGVVTRAEWNGNDTSFRNHDRNRDGVLAGSELRGNGSTR